MQIFALFALCFIVLAEGRPATTNNYFPSSKYAAAAAAAPSRKYGRLRRSQRPVSAFESYEMNAMGNDLEHPKFVENIRVADSFGRMEPTIANKHDVCYLCPAGFERSDFFSARCTPKCREGFEPKGSLVNGLL